MLKIEKQLLSCLIFGGNSPSWVPEAPSQSSSSTIESALRFFVHRSHFVQVDQSCGEFV